MKGLAQPNTGGGGDAAMGRFKQIGDRVKAVLLQHIHCVGNAIATCEVAEDD
ncbi:hypothetical protein X744_29615 [Mesorhizobium sp. LNJC372A00]|nr:hypothetical protein X745_30785 [Mesorhizobium sp. LNJC374B00]ESY52268.1 hypothetical protein X744_29615 [Mesorhizobium sp. LNJC372A00]